MKKNNLYFALMALLSVSFLNVNAQETKPDTLLKAIEQLQSDVALLKNLKISGYAQFQGVFSDSSGLSGNIDKTFQVRRGRVKFAYSSSPLNLFVAQFDITEKGLGTKDVYAKFTDPLVNYFSFTAGLFNRPFGYEIEFSSSLRESPERSRFTTSLFPNERDLGAMLTIQAPKTSQWNFIKIDAGLFAGNSIGVETDQFKDFIGRINYTKTLMGEQMKISANISYYYGGFANGTTQNWKVQNINGVKQFAAKTDVTKGSRAVRELTGADFQVTVNSVLGLTTLRGEYVQGRQPSTQSNSTSPVVLVSTDAYIRFVQGYYVYFVQAIGQTRHSLVFKYDVYDPNTDVSGDDISDANRFTTADIKYSTLGLGYAARLGANVKLTAYYDMVTNEKSGIKNYSKDRKDDLVTLRLQYKF